MNLQEVKTMLSITDKAVEMLKAAISNEKNPDHLFLRISFGGFGWGGRRVNLALDELTTESDHVIETQGVKLVYDEETADFLENAVIDYSTHFLKRGFMVRGAGVSSCWLTSAARDRKHNDRYLKDERYMSVIEKKAGSCS